MSRKQGFRPAAPIRRFLMHASIPVLASAVGAGSVWHDHRFWIGSLGPKKSKISRLHNQRTWFRAVHADLSAYERSHNTHADIPAKSNQDFTLNHHSNNPSQPLSPMIPAQLPKLPRRRPMGHMSYSMWTCFIMLVHFALPELCV